MKPLEKPLLDESLCNFEEISVLEAKKKVRSNANNSMNNSLGIGWSESSIAVSSQNRDDSGQMSPSSNGKQSNEKGQSLSFSRELEEKYIGDINRRFSE